MLTARTGQEPYVEAADAPRGADYRCRGCGAEVVLKLGRLRIAHFAHRPDAGCAFGTGMSLAHLTAQQRIAEALRGRGVIAELEAFMLSAAGDRRIDVLAWPSDRPAARIAIEVQASDMTLDRIAARTLSYNGESIAPLWLRLMDFRSFDRVQSLPFRGTIWIEKYRACAWERWAHDQLGGRLWFLDQGTFMAWRGTFVPAHSYRGRWREVVQWVELELEGPFALSDLRLNRGRMAGADKATRLAAWFVAPGESAAPTAPFVQAAVTGAGRHLQVRVGNRWIPAIVEGAPGNWRSVRLSPSAVLTGMP